MQCRPSDSMESKNKKLNLPGSGKTDVQKKIHDGVHSYLSAKQIKEKYLIGDSPCINMCKC